MAGKLTVTIVSPEDTLYDGDATRLVAPGVRGEIGIYPRHAALIARLVPGVLRVHVPVGDLILKFATRGGFLEVAHDHVTVLVTKALRPRDIDKPEVEDELADVKSQLQNPSTDEHFQHLLERRRWLETCLATWEERHLIDTRGI